MKRRLLALGTALFLAFTVSADERRVQDDRVVEQTRAANVKVTGKRAIVWAPPAWSEEERRRVTAMLDDVIVRVEQLLGTKYAAETYRRPHIEYFISDSDDVPSHVYGAYDHSAAAGDPPYIFLSGLESGEAPHIHETAHIIGGRFGSLFLREGVATYVQFKLQPGRMRPLVKSGNVTDLESLDAAVTAMLAQPKTLELTKAWLANPARIVKFASRPERSIFYATSASFTAFLIDRLGMRTFMRAYATDDPVRAIERATGRAWREWTDEWISQRSSGLRRR